MLHCVQSSTSENFSVVGSNTDMSVLERQRAVLQRMYPDPPHQQSSQLGTNAMPSFNRYQDLMNSMNFHNPLDENSPNFGFACSEITSNTSLDLDQNQRSLSTISATNSSRKRKAEFDAEEECKEKRVEEAGEVQSGLTVKSEKENSGKTCKESSKASGLLQKTDYIHVRARRGQATDSHSLAERARREKISKKMKCLQDLVPGCNKVTGKAGMLDEIINYVQSLQKQVEFLSMKLAALNPRLDFNMEHFFEKEFPACIASFSTAPTPLELIQSAYHHYNQGPHPQGSNSCSVDTSTTPTPAQMVPQRTGTSSISFPEAYLDSISSLQQLQQTQTWVSDWQSIYNVNFH